MNNISKILLELKSDISKLSKQITKLETESELLFAQLQEEFDVPDIPTAKKLAKKLEREVQEMQEELDSKVDEVLREYNKHNS